MFKDKHNACLAVLRMKVIAKLAEGCSGVPSLMWFGELYHRCGPAVGRSQKWDKKREGSGGA